MRAIGGSRRHQRVRPRRPETTDTTAQAVTRWLFVGLACMVASTGCATLDRQVPRVESYAWPEPEATMLGRALAPPTGGVDGKSGFYLLTSGVEAFAMRAALAEAAQRTLDLQYYAVHDDVTGQLLLERLLAAAKR